MRTIIEAREFKEAQYFDGCFLFKLKTPIDKKFYGVINYETLGKEKVGNPKATDFISFEAEYKVGPEAILIKEIL